MRDSPIMQEAQRLAKAGGGLGNSDAIALLHIPHSSEDVLEILRVFDGQLSREAKSKLTLDAIVPLPPGVVNQRYAPIFDRHIVTGRTYTTANGDVVPNELQYYDGEMAHFYGECANVSAVHEVLAGSGYKTVVLKHEDARQSAVAQLWSSRFTDSSIGPYGAMFIVVVVVPDDAPPSQGFIRADPSGGSSALVMFNGTFDAATAVYENRARLFLVRLLDTTRVAVDVGRERMGTDKRPGTVEMGCNNGRLVLSIEDQGGRGVARGDVELATSSAYLTQVAKAAATAGIQFPMLPPGTEYAYPAAARIGRGPVVSWQWRSDAVPRLQSVAPGRVTFDPSSEEGRMLLAWGFVPKVLGYIPNVRGVITGLTERKPPYLGVGSTAHWGTTSHSSLVAGAATTSAPAFAAARPVEYPSLPGRADASGESVAILRAHLPGQPGVAGRLAVLRLVAPKSSLHLQASTELAAQGAHRAGPPIVSDKPNWAWETTFLGSLSAMLRKEVVGVTPDGLRINWHVTEGRFVGPDLDAIILPGAADWMRIRRDGVAIVSVQACFETRDGARVYGSYGGMFDLGPDGYAKAQRDEYDALPPVVVAPTYATADTRLQWLNRAQCVGVGRVDMNALRVEFDVHVVRVGDRTHQDLESSAARASLYDRLGGREVIVAASEDFVSRLLTDQRLTHFFPGGQAHIGKEELEKLVDLLCDRAGGPCVYKGRDMRTAHKGLRIADADWKIAVDLFTASLNGLNVASQPQSELLQIIESMKDEIVEVRGMPQH
jgi:truncated hemoglobin YjbI